jgi:membrane protein involved in colicin uptake
MFGKSTEKIKIYNRILSSNVAEKTITIHWRFSETDYKLISDKNEEWKIQEAERKAKEETDRKAKEEAERIEAENKAEAERQAAQERAKQQQSNTKPSTSPTPSSSSGSSGSSYNSGSNSNNSPSSGVSSTVSGYCNDGTYVTGNPSARGKANACYGHKGWRDY